MPAAGRVHPDMTGPNRPPTTTAAAAAETSAETSAAVFSRHEETVSYELFVVLLKLQS